MLHLAVKINLYHVNCYCVLRYWINCAKKDVEGNLEVLIDVFAMPLTRRSYSIGSGKRRSSSANCLDKHDQHNQCSLIYATKTDVGVQVSAALHSHFSYASRSTAY